MKYTFSTVNRYENASLNFFISENGDISDILYLNFAVRFWGCKIFFPE